MPNTPQGKIRAALETLVKKLEQIHADPAYQGVWTIYQTHCGPYRGPQYADELQKAREALNVYERPLPPALGAKHLPLETVVSEKVERPQLQGMGVEGIAKNAAPQMPGSASAGSIARPTDSRSEAREVPTSAVAAPDNALVAQSLERSLIKRGAEGSRSSECTHSQQFDKYGTPRTDAAEFTTYTEQIKVVEAEVARQLERELAIALGIIQTRKRYEAPSAKGDKTALDCLRSDIRSMIDHRQFANYVGVEVIEELLKRHSYVGEKK